MGSEDLFIAPELTEFHALDDDAVRLILFYHGFKHIGPLVDLLLGHEARAEVRLEVVAADRLEGRFTLSDFDLLPARDRAEAVAVSDDAGAAELEQLGELGVVDLRTGQDDSGAEFRFGIRGPVADLFERFAQIRQDQPVRTDFTDELDEVELIARDRRVVEFPEVPDLGDDGTDFVVVFDGREQCFIGRVDPQCGKVREHLVPQFVHVIHECRPVVLQRGVDDRSHERIVLDRRDLFKMLLHTFHG